MLWEGMGALAPQTGQWVALGWLAWGPPALVLGLTAEQAALEQAAPSSGG